VGSGATLEGAPTIVADGSIRIGDRFYLASRPVASHLITGTRGTLSIGDDVAIGHGAAIAAYADIDIAEGTRIGPNVIIIDTDFHVVGDRLACAETARITVGRNVRIGSRVTVLRGSQIQDGARIAAGSVVSGVISEGSLVSGVPARALVPADSGGLPSIGEVVMRSFGLAALPADDDGPREIPHWDSLGALKLLLALEEAFGVTLSEHDLAGATRVADLSGVVDRALAHGASLASPLARH
jgi:acetyltransferase-like isoleucine patch superfamily enzyme/acyl carrier protein